MYKKKYIKLFITLLFIFGIFYFNNTTYAATIRQGKVTATAGLRLRSEPNTNSSKILTVPYNSIVRIEEDSTSGNGCSNKWVKAVYPLPYISCGICRHAQTHEDQPYK